MSMRAPNRLVMNGDPPPLTIQDICAIVGQYVLTLEQLRREIALLKTELAARPERVPDR
jgi:hypothetical protein